MAFIAANRNPMQMSIDVTIPPTISSRETCIPRSSLDKLRKSITVRPTPPRNSTFSHQKSPSTSSSIPSRYKTFFFATTERKGLNSQATRFSAEQNINENPGPGTYGTDKKTLEQSSSSFSKKGTGGFASKSHRFVPEREKDLSPGSYYPHPLESRIDFNRVNASSNFQLPIAIITENNNRKSSHSPAPNTYDLSDIHTGKNSTVSAEAAFKSKSRRVMSVLSTNPAPCQYTVEDSVLHPLPRSLQSVFNSKSHRGCKEVKLGPGPADYSPVWDELSDTSKTAPHKQLPHYRQKHYLCISAPAMPLPPLQPTPGPGHYETQSALIEPNGKKLLAGSMFKSTTTRWTSTDVNEPGPGTYNPVAPSRQSYLYNSKKKWI